MSKLMAACAVAKTLCRRAGGTNANGMSSDERRMTNVGGDTPPLQKDGNRCGRPTIQIEIED